MSKTEKGGKYCLATRKGQTLSDFCALMGANKSVLTLQEMIVKKYVDGKTARACNLDRNYRDSCVAAGSRDANINRTQQWRLRTPTRWSTATHNRGHRGRTNAYFRRVSRSLRAGRMHACRHADRRRSRYRGVYAR